VCYFVYLASPLTLSEVRSMLPEGLVADALPVAEQQVLQGVHYDANIGARILHGECSCDLVRERDPDPGVDEAVHRQRYRQLGYDRGRMVRYLERHRGNAGGGRPPRPRPPGYWGDAFNAFVVEHARNAGPTLFYRHFSHEGLLKDEGIRSAVRKIPVAEVRGPVAEWLPEGVPVLVR